MDIDEPSVRDSIDRWMRILTIHGDTNLTSEERNELLQQVNPPSFTRIEFDTKLDEREKQELSNAVTKVGKQQTYQTAAHLAIDEILISWLAQATGTPRSQIIQRLGLTLAAMPEDTDN